MQLYFLLELKASIRDILKCLNLMVEELESYLQRWKHWEDLCEDTDTEIGHGVCSELQGGAGGWCLLRSRDRKYEVDSDFK